MSHEENLRILERQVETFNAGDRDAMLAVFSDDVVIKAPPGWPEGGTYVGREGAESWVDNIKEPWSSDVLRAEDPVQVGERIVVCYRWRGRGKGSGIESELVAFAVLTIGDEGISGVDFYWHQDEALEAAQQAG